MNGSSHPPLELIDLAPTPDELAMLSTVEQKRALLFEHLRRLRETYGDECPNCGGDLSREELLFHVKVGAGVCSSSPPPGRSTE